MVVRIIPYDVSLVESLRVPLLRSRQLGVKATRGSEFAIQGLTVDPLGPKAP